MKNYDLGTEKIGRLIRHFLLPCVISMLVAALYNIVDQFCYNHFFLRKKLLLSIFFFFLTMAKP